MSLRRVLSLAIGAVVAFTTAPLRIVTVLGVLTLCFGFVVGTEALISWWRGVSVSGFATLLITTSYRWELNHDQPGDHWRVYRKDI